MASSWPHLALGFFFSAVCSPVLLFCFLVLRSSFRCSCKDILAPTSSPILSNCCCLCVILSSYATLWLISVACLSQNQLPNFPHDCYRLLMRILERLFCFHMRRFQSVHHVQILIVYLREQFLTSYRPVFVQSPYKNDPSVPWSNFWAAVRKISS